MTRRVLSKGWIGGLLLIGAMLVPTPALAATVNSVSFTEYACPANIQTPTDLANAGGADAACAVAGRTGDFGTLEPGFTWEIDPVEYDLQATLVGGDGSVLTNPDATAGGFCNPTAMTCHAYQNYGWFGVAAGKLLLTEDTVPTGYTFGWAEIQINGKAGRGTVDATARSISLRAHPHIDQVFIRIINIVP
jgi:hypothetical protein